MAINLDDILSLEPTKVSRDLSGYITYLYGQPKVGKTTMAKDMGALILGFEDGTRAMSGAYRMVMKTWNDVKSIVRYSKDERFKARYKAIAVDTVDICASLCEQFICQQNDVEGLSKIPYGGGYVLFKKEFESVFRTLSLEGYAILFISHDKTKTITRQNGTEYVKIVPTVSDSINNIVKNMSDIIAYAYQEPESDERYLVLRSNGEVEAGTRFPHMASKIKFSYNDLVEALNAAIDQEAVFNGSDAVTEERIAITPEEEYDFEALKEEFQTIVAELMNKNQTYYAPRVTKIVETYFGKNRKLSEATLEQVELVAAVVKEIKETLC